MARPGRHFEEGRIYHIYNRVGGGWAVFEDEELARRFVAFLRGAMDRDGVTVLAWCLPGNHYHLVLRQGAVSLSRSMKTLQQGVTRARNLRDRV